MTLHCTTLHYTKHIELQLHKTTLITLHYTYNYNYNCNYNCNYNYSYTTLPLQYTRAPLHYNTLHYTALHPAGVVDVPNHSKNTTPTTFRSISGFALPSMHQNSSPLLQFIFETSAAALCGTTGRQNHAESTPSACVAHHSSLFFSLPIFCSCWVIAIVYSCESCSKLFLDGFDPFSSRHSFRGSDECWSPSPASSKCDLWILFYMSLQRGGSWDARIEMLQDATIWDAGEIILAVFHYIWDTVIMVPARSSQKLHVLSVAELAYLPSSNRSGYPRHKPGNDFCAEWPQACHAGSVWCWSETGEPCRSCPRKRKKWSMMINDDQWWSVFLPHVCIDISMSLLQDESLFKVAADRAVDAESGRRPISIVGEMVTLWARPCLEYFWGCKTSP